MLISSILLLIEQLSSILSSQFKPYLSQLLLIILPYIHKQNNHTIRILQFIRRINYQQNGQLDGNKSFIILHLLKVIEAQDKTIKQRIYAIDTISYLLKNYAIDHHLVSLMSILTNILTLPFFELQIAVLHLLCILIQKIHFQYIPFEANIQRSLDIHLAGVNNNTSTTNNVAEDEHQKKKKKKNSWKFITS